VDAELSVGGDDAGPVLDDHALADYRRRAQELQEDIDEAESFNDIERAAGARAELGSIIDELSRSVGLGGRVRRSVSMGERARVSVTKALRSALQRIAAADQALGAHLEATVRTGTFCSYNPDPRMDVSWKVLDR
jgi:non-specific serine/threonine protein kinase